MNNIEKLNLQHLLNIEDDEKRAYELVSILFKEKTDKEGQPYIGHLERVSNKLTNKNTRIAGLLHDTVEDTDLTFEDLRYLKFNEKIIELVRIVTHEPLSNSKTTYHDIITSIIETNNIEAIKLKCSDITDNCNLERLNRLDPSTRDYLYNKYQPELERLKNILNERGEKL